MGASTIGITGAATLVNYAAEQDHPLFFEERASKRAGNLRFGQELFVAHEGVAN